jgi:hypothetical protein
MTKEWATEVFEQTGAIASKGNCSAVCVINGFYSVT